MPTHRRPPGDVNDLRRRSTAYANEIDQSFSTLQEQTKRMVLAAMLEDLTGKDGQPLFLVKGGAALELRRPFQSRATKDLDLSLVDEAAVLDEAFQRVLQQRWGDFSLILKERVTRAVGPLNVLSATIGITYKNKDWSSLRVEISPADGVSVVPEEVAGHSLAHLGIEGPATVRCTPISHQAAQKLHACTEPKEHNDRVRDVLDLLLVEDLIRQHLAQTRVTCVEVFAARGTHEWPPIVTPRDNWPPVFAKLAKETDYDTHDLDVARERLQALVDAVAQS